MNNINIDPEFQLLIPLPSDEEYRQLEANILSEGCRDALVIWNGTLVDGHNRYKICTQHDLAFTTLEKNFESRDDAIQWIILNQFGRRNLSPGNRSILALRLEPIIKEKAKDRMLAGKKTDPTQKSAQGEDGETRHQVAKIAGVSHDTIDKVKRIVKQGTPEQIERIKKGDKGNTVNAVYSEIKNTNPQKAKPEPKPTDSPKQANSFKEIVNRLKDVNTETAYTPQMLIEEYGAFSSRFVSDLMWFEQKQYLSVYSKMSHDNLKKIMTLNTAMLKAIEKIIEKQKG